MLCEECREQTQQPSADAVMKWTLSHHVEWTSWSRLQAVGSKVFVLADVKNKNSLRWVLLERLAKLVNISITTKIVTESSPFAFICLSLHQIIHALLFVLFFILIRQSNVSSCSNTQSGGSQHDSDLINHLAGLHMNNGRTNQYLCVKRSRSLTEWEI